MNLLQQDKGPDNMRTPFVKQQSGRWALFLIEGKEIEYGHRFDPGIGYRVYIKFKDSIMANCFVAHEARKLAAMISQRETNEDILNIGIIIKQMAGQVVKLNDAWTALGCPEQALDQMAGGTA